MAVMPKDAVIPIVFPAYLIRVDTPPVEIRVPDIPLIHLPHRVHIPRTTEKLPFLGHAGALFFDGRNGTTKYYEYGRYDPAALGITRNVHVPDLVLTSGNPSRAGLLGLLRHISRASGQGGAIVGAYIEVHPGGFAHMLGYCQRRIHENANPRRPPYDLLSNSCCHFMKGVADAGGASMPSVIPPNPAGYIRVVRMSYPSVDYTASPESVSVPSLHI